MKWKPLSSPACIVLAALCLFNSGAWAAPRHPHRAKKHRAQTQRGGHTYRNPDYGFTISYPPSIKPVNSARGENTGGYARVCDDTTIACFAYTGQAYKGTNFEGAGIAINILREANAQQCNNIATAAYPQPTPRSESIHGTLFRVGDTGEGGMSHEQSITAYRTVYQNVCFEIRTQINTVSLGAYDPGTLKPFHPARLNALLRDMAHTFRFVGPVKYGVAWKVSRDSGCGGTYEYPADAAAEIVVDTVGDLSNSDRMTCSRSFTFGGRRYTLDVKSGNVDDEWLKSRGYPPLKDAMVVSKSAHYTDYRAGSYYYVHGQAQLFIFSVSDANHRAVDPGDDPIYRHWLASFKAM